MKLDLPKSFAKYYYKSWCVWLAVATLLAATHVINFGTCLFFFLLSVARDGYHFKAHIAKVDKLKARGLTEEDIANIEFVKKWDETRKEGLWKYCMKDGGIIAGALLSLPGAGIVALIDESIVKSIFLGPDKMMAFIGYSYLTGAILGIVTYRVLWTINERRFLRLTDPLNTIFTNKKETFSDLI